MRIERIIKNKQYLLEVSIYLIWVILNIVLFQKSFESDGMGSQDKYFFPFNYRCSSTCLWAYNISEFVLYTIILPFVIIGMYKYALSMDDRKIKNRYARIIWIIIIYCFVFAIVAMFDDAVLIEFMLNIAKAIAKFLLVFYITCSILDRLINKKS